MSAFIRGLDKRAHSFEAQDWHGLLALGVTKIEAKEGGRIGARQLASMIPGLIFFRNGANFKI